jgi:hypothetical protein
MLLDKANVINDHLPCHQTRGERNCPDWIECEDIEYTSVNGIQKNSAKTKRQIQKEMLRRTEYEDETESESEV